MADEIQLITKRFQELSKRAYAQQRYMYSEFLTLAEQDLLQRSCNAQNAAPYILFGGFEAAERKVAQFGSEELCGYKEELPIHCVSMMPVSQKFADALTHRDFLGALMALGIRRSVLGDIILHENCGFVFCLESISSFIVQEFKQVKHTMVTCEVITELPDIIIKQPELSSINVASERLDAVIAAVYKMSRSESQELFTQNKVFVNSSLTDNTSFQPENGTVISVRGHGRFIYEGIVKETKKGRLFVSVRIY
jgi:RNA-binding protein YlmH